MALLLLSAPMQLLAQNGTPGPGKPEWTTPLNLSTDSGEARLEWSPKKGEVVALYRVTETSLGREGIFYVDGQALDVYRVDPGDYRFSLQACNKDVDGPPVCGPASRQLVLTVTEEIWADDPVNDSAAVPIVASSPAGPEVLRPGYWHNPGKVGQGWSLYWANRLVTSANPPIPYDLYVIWYTYEAKTRTITPICEPPQSPCGNEIEYFNYRPVVVTMNLVKSTSNNNYVGAIYIQRNGTVFNVGAATVVFGTGNTAAKISWTATFKKQSLLSATDDIVLLAGSSGSSISDASHYAGLWGDTSASSYLIDDVGSLSETVETVFYDGNGDPTWIQAFQGRTPLATDTSLCFYHIQGGYQPDLNQSALPGALYTTCDPENATSASRNGRRYFTDFEVGRFWVNFTLPPGVVDPNQVAGGSVSIGTSTTPASKTKAANFHRIWFTGGNTCQINVSSPSCLVNLAWFTDGDYPNATAYRYNQTTGQRSLIATSTQPIMENQQVSIAAVGSYVFELRMSNSTSSALIARSSLFTVTQASNISPTAAFTANCTLLSCTFTDLSSDSDGSIASRSWSFGDGGTSTAQNPSHSYAAAGTYTVSLTVTDNQGAANSTSRSVTVSAVNQTPTAAFNASCTLLSCTFTDLSSDSDGSIASRSWNFGDGGTSSAQNPSHSYASSGTYTVSLTVTDNQGASKSTSKNVTVSNAGGQALEVFFDSFENGAWNGLWTEDAQNDWFVSTQRATAGTHSAEVDGGASNAALVSVPIDLQGHSAATVTFNWLIEFELDAGEYLAFDVSTNGGSSWTERARLRGDVDAENIWHPVQVDLTSLSSLRLRFRGLMSASTEDANVDEVRVTVASSAVNQSPTAAFNASCTNLSCAFTDLSSDSDGTIASRAWSFGDGGTSTAQNPSHTYAVAGSYTVSLTVTDNAGASGSTSKSVTVTAANQNPTAAFSANCTNLNCAFADQSSDSDGTIASRAWSFGDGGTSTVQNPSHSYAAAGSYTVALTVTDNTGASNAASQSVTVTAANTAPQVTIPADQSTLQGSTITPLAIQVADAENDPVTCTITGLPAGLIESSECTVSGTVSAASGVYTVSVSASDGRLTSAAVSFSWNITPAGPPANPETPPAPVASPSLAPSAASSQVGATAGAFRVDESGNASYRIPLLTAPGSGGVAPQLSLEYSSQDGNGPLGVGWSLGGQSVISRCAQTLAADGPNAVRGITLTATDRFCLDGQRLIAVTGQYGADGTEYRTQIDPIAKIVSNGSAGSGPQSFTVWRKDGSVTQYGASADARIEARTPSDTQTVLLWAQNRVSDSAGNYIDYVYDEIAGVAGIEYVLKQVLYTGNTTAGTTPYAQIDFIYTSTRPDATLAYVAGAAVQQTRQLTRIDSRARTDAGSALQTLRSYLLAYGTDGHGRRMLTAVTECRDSTQSYCFAPTTFGWQTSKHGIGSSATSVGSLFDSKHAATAIADVSGDGRPELLLTRKNGSGFQFRVLPALATGGFGASTTYYPIPNNGSNTTPATLHAIDLNADGFQDVIYPTSSGWKGRLSNSGVLGSEIPIGSCCDLTDPPLVQVMDFDGDGLSDVVTQRAKADGGKETVWLRNLFTPASPTVVGFAAPVALSIAIDANLFPQSSGSWFIDTELPEFRVQNAITKAFQRPFDYDGDGKVDLLAQIKQRYFQCSGSCAPNQPVATGNTRVLSQFAISDSANVQGGSAQGGSYAWASYYLVLLADGANGFVQADVVANGGDCTVSAACTRYPGLPQARQALPVDINADGLADFAWQDTAEDWSFRLNSGGGFSAQSVLIADLTDGAQSHEGVFADLTGDGLPDFLYPSAINSQAATWQMRENLFGAAFGTVQNTGDSFGNSAEFDQSLLLDFSGDGIVDNLFIDLNAQGAVQATSTRLFSGVNVAGGAATAAVNVVTSITDGFGANTALTYKPLTDASVYTRMRDSASANWGGFAVYDLVAPIYVVSQAASSAPTDANPGAMSRVEYHYLGAKLQGAGRGFLGFGEIISYDPQSGIRINTRYRQDFPFIGLPADTTRALAGSSQRFDHISNTAASTPVAWGNVTATTAAATLPSGTLLSYAINAWQAVETVAGAWFPYLAASLERSYTLTGGFGRKVLTSNTYNNVYGNLDSVILDTYATDGATALATQTTSNSYADDVAKWRLGRLATSTVTHARSGKPSLTRSSSFGYATNGILNRETIQPGDVTLEVNTTYQLDLFGNRSMTTITGAGMAARSRTEVYDALGRYVNESRNAYGQSGAKVTQHDAFGNALRVQNIDGVVTDSAADFMGRPFISRTASGAWNKTTLVAGAGTNCPAAHTVYHAIKTGGGQPTQYQCFDRLGREVRTATQGFNGTLIDVDTRYDALGRVARVSEPYFAGAAAYWNDTVYDAIGRISAAQAADGNDLTYDYDSAASLCSTPGAARQTRTTNGLGQSLLELRNVLGETIKVIDNACGVVSSDYDATGNLTLLTGADGAQTVMSYDLAGRKIAMSDPDKGAWQYAYNALGELTRQRDSKSQALDFVYDLLGRVTARYERSGVSSLGATTYTTVNSETTAWINSASASVTGKAQPSVITYRVGTAGAIVQQQNLGYDAFGRLSIRSTSQDGLILAEETTYDQYGRVFQQFDVSGDGRGIRYHYNASGYVEKLQEAREGAAGVLYQHIQSQDQRGNITYMILGNGVEAFAEYRPQSGRLLTLDAYDINGVELQRVDYTFDVLGNLQGRHDTSQSQNLDETFRYDLMNRLETVLLSTNGAAVQTKLTLQYHAAGNIQSKSDVGSYLYGSGSAGPHAVTSAGGITYTYDANGNQVSSSDGRTISYTLFDQAARIQKGAEFTEFSYGIGNRRIKRVDDNAVDAVKTTWTFGSVERIQQGSQNAYFKRYVGDIALVDYFPATQAQDIRYLIKDHLGSIHTLTDEGGLVSSAVTMHFGAFGQRQSTAWTGALSASGMMLHNLLTTRGFTGHEHADGLGIIHMNGRIYDPKLGRFLQADPFVQALDNSQSLNRYSYVLNNPLSYTDPSGYFSLSAFWKKVRPFVAIGIAIWNPGALWFSGVWGAATSGFLAGYVASGSLKGAVAGAFSAAAFYAIGSSFESLAGTGAWGGSGLSGEAFAVKTILHGAAGGILALGTGGKFGHGFISAGLTQAFSGRIGGLRSAFGRIAAAAVLGGTSSAITGGKFANGAVTGAFSRAFNDGLHPFFEKTLNELQARRFWTAFAGLKPEEFRTLFPKLSMGRDDFDITIVQGDLYQEFYSSGLASRVLETAHDANDLLRDYSVGRVTGMVGARGKLTGIIGKVAGLTATQMDLIKEAIGLKAFADQQGVNLYQLRDLARILNQGEVSIGEAIKQLEALE